MKRYAISPVTELDIVKGKRYLVSDWNETGGRYGSFSITDDVGFELYCLIKGGCAHIQNKQWTIVEEKEPSDG